MDGFLNGFRIMLAPHEEELLVDYEWSKAMIDYAETDVKYKKYKYSCLNRAVDERGEGGRVLSIPQFWVSEEKGSLFEKMQGDENERFARMRLFYSFMMLQPGKKMLFMGSEFGEKNSWNEERALDWYLMECQPNSRLKKYVREINLFYLRSSAMWGNDRVEWIERLDEERGIMSFARVSERGEKIFAVFNFGDKEGKSIYVGEKTDMILDSDEKAF